MGSLTKSTRLKRVSSDIPVEFSLRVAALPQDAQIAFLGPCVSAGERMPAAMMEADRVAVCGPAARAVPGSIAIRRPRVRDVDQSVPAELDIHPVMDNRATHATPRVKAWFARRPLSHLRFTPISDSWDSLVKRCFALLSERKIKRGSNRGTVELEQAIRHCLSVYDKNPTPFVWHKTADQIIESVGRSFNRISDPAHEVPYNGNSITYHSANPMCCSFVGLCRGECSLGPVSRR